MSLIPFAPFSELGEGGLQVFYDFGGDDVGIGEIGVFMSFAPFYFLISTFYFEQSLMIRTIIDISHWEDPIDFKKVAAAGIVAVIAKATQGAAGIDIAYAKFKKLATKYEFLWGSYHFGTGSKVNVQVDHYLKIAKPTDRELVCLDFEPNPNGPTMTLTQAREFISLFQHLTGRYPVLYSGHLLKENLGGKPDDLLSKCRLWLAQYGPKPVLPVGWKQYTLWQYTDGDEGPPPRRVPGIGPCDRNQFNGTTARLRKLWPFAK